MLTDQDARVIRGWASLDLAFTFPLALPPLAEAFLGLLFRINGALGGLPSPPPFDPLHAFFVSLAGALGVLWAVVRIRQPARALGLADALGRCWVGALIAFFVFAQDAPVALLGFCVTELAGAAHQLFTLRTPGER